MSRRAGNGAAVPGWCVAFAAGAALVVQPCAAAEDERPAEDLIHSDLPLFTDYRDSNMWPQPVRGDDTEEGWAVGCASAVAFGEWMLESAWEDEVAGWFRFTNYGAFHCFAIIGEAYERDELEDARWDLGFFVELGDTTISGRKIELWAIQLGSQPGSDYLLLAREPGGEETIRRFDLLQRKCPRANIRDAGPIDIATTRYCAINSRRELVAFAKRMARLKPIGKISLVPENEGPDAEPGPSEIE